MKKGELLSFLQTIPGNPSVVFYDGESDPPEEWDAEPADFWVEGGTLYIAVGEDEEGEDPDGEDNVIDVDFAKAV